VAYFDSTVTKNGRHTDVFKEPPDRPSDDNFYVTWSLTVPRATADVESITLA